MTPTPMDLIALYGTCGGVLLTGASLLWIRNHWSDTTRKPTEEEKLQKRKAARRALWHEAHRHNRIHADVYDFPVPPATPAREPAPSRMRPVVDSVFHFSNRETDEQRRKRERDDYERENRRWD